MSDKNKVFETPISALYKFYDYDRIGRSAELKVTNVEVLEESVSGKSFKIKILNHNIENHKKGDVIWVQKNSIIMPKNNPDYTNAPWNQD